MQCREIQRAVSADICYYNHVTIIKVTYIYIKEAADLYTRKEHRNCLYDITLIPIIARYPWFLPRYPDSQILRFSAVRSRDTALKCRS